MTRSIMATMFSLLLLLTACAKGGGSGNSAPGAGPGTLLKPGDFPNVANEIYGVWNSDTAEFGSGLAYLLTFYFNEKDQVGVMRTCVGAGEEVRASTVVSGEISATQISIKQAARVTEKGGRISDCTLIINEGSFSYKRTGDRLEVTFWPGDTRKFSRASK